MPRREPSVLNFIGDLFLFVALSVVMFVPLFAFSFLCWLAWKVFIG
jgi:hypothetical protein